MAFCCSSAVIQAWRAGLSIVIGALKNPITASPIYLSSVPLLAMRILVISERYSESTLKSFSAPRSSEIVVKPAISEKKIVISRFSHQSLSVSG